MSDDGKSAETDPQDVIALAAQLSARIEELSAKAALCDSILSKLADAHDAAQAETDRRASAATQLDTIQARISKRQSEVDAEISTLTESVASLSGKEQAAEAAVAAASTSRTTIEEHQNASAAAAAEISAFEAQTKEHAAGAEAAHNALKNSQQAIDQQISSLTERVAVLSQREGDANRLLEQIQTFKSESETARGATEANAAAVAEAKQKFDTLRNETEASFAALSNERQAAEAKIAAIDEVHDRLMREQSAILEDRDDTNKDGAYKSVASSVRAALSHAETLVASIKNHGEESARAEAEVVSNAKSDWEGIRTDFKEQSVGLLSSTTSQFQALKATLEDEIRRLLPSAGAAGLAWSYFDAKAKYGPTKFDYTGELAHKLPTLKYWLLRIAHAVQSHAVPTLFYAFFMLPLLAVMYIFFEIVQSIEKHGGHWDSGLILYRFFISLPAIAASYFGWSSIRLYRRLFEEYNHKQRVMELYQSFKKEIATLGSPEEQKLLLAIMLKTVDHQPAVSMHKYDKGAEGLFPTFDLAQLFSSIFGKRPETPHETE